MSQQRREWMVRLIRTVLVLLLGASLGASAATALISLRIDALLLERDRLILSHNRLQANYRALEERLEQRRPPVIREIRLKLNGIEDPALRLALEEALEPFLSELRGQTVSQIDPALAAAIFRNRIVQVQNRSFRLQLQWLVLGETTLLQIDASAIESEQSRIIAD